MDASVQAAMIAAAGGIVGIIVKSFAPELKTLVTGRARTNSDLVGTWECNWLWVENETGDEREIDDRVEISRVWGEELWAIGTNTQYGDYKIKGRVSRSSLVTLHYEGQKQRQPLGGVVIMRLSATRDKMIGRYYEFGLGESIVGGPTVWKKSER